MFVAGAVHLKAPLTQPFVRAVGRVRTRATERSERLPECLARSPSDCSPVAAVATVKDHFGASFIPVGTADEHA